MNSTEIENLGNELIQHLKPVLDDVLGVCNARLKIIAAIREFFKKEIKKLPTASAKATGKGMDHLDDSITYLCGDDGPCH